MHLQSLPLRRHRGSFPIQPLLVPRLRQRLPSHRRWQAGRARLMHLPPHLMCHPVARSPRQKVESLQGGAAQREWRTPVPPAATHRRRSQHFRWNSLPHCGL